MMKLN